MTSHPRSYTTLAVGPAHARQGVQDAGDAVRRHLGGAATHDRRADRVGTEQGDPDGRRDVERQDAVVGEQDDRLRRRPTEQRHVSGGRRLGIGRRLRGVEGADAIEAAEQAADGAIEVRLVELAGVNGREDGRSQCPRRAGHLEVEAGAQRHRRLGHGEPIRHDETVEAPLVPQDVEEELGLLGQPAPVEPVVPGHDRECPALADRDLEGQQVELAQGALVNDRVDGGALELRVVADEVLDGREDAVGLDAADIARREGPGEERVLGVALEVATGQGRAMQVHRGSEETATTAVERFSPDERPQGLRRARVPRGPDGRAAGNADRGRAARAGERIPSGTRGAVRDVDLGDAQALDRDGGHHVLSCGESSLLRKRQCIH